MRTTQETALLIALLLKRSGNARARVSESTIRKLGKRQRIRSAFLSRLQQDLDDFGITLIEIGRGFGLIRTSVLDGAPVVTAKKHLADVLPKLKQGKMDFEGVRDEVEEDVDESDDDE